AQDEEARRQAQASLDNLERQRQKTDIDIEIYKLNLKQQETNLERAKQRLENALLRSPINGIVSFAEGLDPGDWVDSNRTICTVVDPTNLYLRLNSTSVSGLYMGMAADVEINGETYKGTVVMTPNSTSQRPSDQRLRNAIILTVDDLPLSVLPGDQAIVRVLLEQRSDALVIPKAGLRTYGSRNYVLVREGDKNREVDIDIGMQTATYLEVISGLEEGDVIILR
ncbi:MAG TPA: HlyD family efflux transporter periplasmic adaptor subunit, partial [Candidatus Atribacteria bacterium]|nr:HlyD family efflux transporter periplasmic adaptor subunit [Candidatus Atribacteria bacterium]